MGRFLLRHLLDAGHNGQRARVGAGLGRLGRTRTLHRRRLASRLDGRLPIQLLAAASRKRLVDCSAVGRKARQRVEHVAFADDGVHQIGVSCGTKETNISFSITGELRNSFRPNVEIMTQEKFNYQGHSLFRAWISPVHLGQLRLTGDD